MAEVPLHGALQAGAAPAPGALRFLSTLPAKAAARTATAAASTEQRIYLKHDLLDDLNFTSVKCKL